MKYKETKTRQDEALIYKKSYEHMLDRMKVFIDLKYK